MSEQNNAYLDAMQYQRMIVDQVRAAQACQSINESLGSRPPDGDNPVLLLLEG